MTNCRSESSARFVTFGGAAEPCHTAHVLELFSAIMVTGLGWTIVTGFVISIVTGFDTSNVLATVSVVGTGIVCGTVTVLGAGHVVEAEHVFWPNTLKIP